MADGSWLARLRRIVFRPDARPSRGLIVLSALAFCTIGYGSSAPGGYFPFLLVSLYLAPLVAAYACIAFLVALRNDAEAVRANWIEWAIAPALAIALTLRVPLYVRFLVSLPAMNAAADEAWRASRNGELEYRARELRQVGLYDRCEVRFDPSTRASIIAVTETGFISTGAFAFVHGDETPTATPDRYSRMFGHWHKVILDF